MFSFLFLREIYANLLDNRFIVIVVINEWNEAKTNFLINAPSSTTHFRVLTKQNSI